MFSEQSHEPLTFSSLGISSAADEVLADNSQSNPLIDFTNIDMERCYAPLECNTSLKRRHTISALDYGPSPVSTRTSSTRLTSPVSMGQPSLDMPGLKKEISPTWTNFACDTCKKTFTHESHYRLHARKRECAVASASYPCNACKRTFKLSKDLKRHQGSRASSSSCPGLKTKSLAVKRFACSCDRHSYPRKDSLQRNMDTANAREERQPLHECKNCLRSRCQCK
ncbi:hypothetical protein NX059_007923 [Plenodomus lindquistii]|nr:hypothetical protein NX059_007923 [Plenodomus lindquistii]